MRVTLLEALAKRRQIMMCAKDRLNLRWGSDDPWRTSSFGGVGKRQ